MRKYVYCVMLLIGAWGSESIASSQKVEKCPFDVGYYGNKKRYQELACRYFISADNQGDSRSRNVTINDEGMIQIFNNFPGTTNSNSTGARVYYIFPMLGKKEILQAKDTLRVKHGSGIVLEFDKNGKVSSKDLVMSVSDNINSQNKSGVEITSYSRGLVFDLGYRMGNTPALNPNAKITITDKKNKKCEILNKEVNNIKGDEHTFRYTDNLALHGFLAKRCPQLDIVDLLNASQSFKEETLNLIKSAGSAPAKKEDSAVNDSKRNKKEIEFETMEELLESIGEKTIGR